MRPLVLSHRYNRRVLLEHGWQYLKSFVLYSLMFFRVLRNFLYVVLYALFVPVKVYKLESPERPPHEVNLKEEYLQNKFPPRPFC
jgi:hypothetical protein